MKRLLTVLISAVTDRSLNSLSFSDWTNELTPSPIRTKTKVDFCHFKISASANVYSRPCGHFYTHWHMSRFKSVIYLKLYGYMKELMAVAASCSTSNTNWGILLLLAISSSNQSELKLCPQTEVI